MKQFFIFVFFVTSYNCSTCYAQNAERIYDIYYVFNDIVNKISNHYRKIINSHVIITDSVFIEFDEKFTIYINDSTPIRTIKNDSIILDFQNTPICTDFQSVSSSLINGKKDFYESYYFDKAFSLNKTLRIKINFGNTFYNKDKKRIESRWWGWCLFDYKYKKRKRKYAFHKFFIHYL